MLYLVLALVYVKRDSQKTCLLTLLLSSQSNSLLVPDSLRSTDKRRNGPDYSSDLKKRKVDDKDSSHYVSKSVKDD